MGGPHCWESGRRREREAGAGGGDRLHHAAAGRAGATMCPHPAALLQIQLGSAGPPTHAAASPTPPPNPTPTPPPRPLHLYSRAQTLKREAQTSDLAARTLVSARLTCWDAQHPFPVAQASRGHMSAVSTAACWLCTAARPRAAPPPAHGGAAGLRGSWLQPFAATGCLLDGLWPALPKARRVALAGFTSIGKSLLGRPTARPKPDLRLPAAGCWMLPACRFGSPSGRRASWPPRRRRCCRWSK